jgi:hypothetical protein
MTSYRDRTCIVWTDDDIATLKDLWNKGHTAVEIAAVIGKGLSKSAVIAKRSRLGFERAEAYIPKRSMAKAARDAGALQKPMNLRLVTPPPAPINLPRKVITGGTSGRLADLERDDCRWIVQDGPPGHMDQAVMCGEPKREGSAYCASHHALTIVKRPSAAQRAANRARSVRLSQHKHANGQPLARFVR